LYRSSSARYVFGCSGLKEALVDGKVERVFEMPGMQLGLAGVKRSVGMQRAGDLSLPGENEQIQAGVEAIFHAKSLSGVVTCAKRSIRMEMNS
jgi:hypothetical protein